MPVWAPVRPRAEVIVANPAKLDSWSWENIVAITVEEAVVIEPAPDLRQYYARMAARFRAMPRPARHEHGPTGEIEPF